MLTNPKTRLGVAMLAFFAFLGIFGPMLAPYDPGKRSQDLLQAPSGKHWLGTTHLGQDIFSQILVGARSILFVGFVAGAIATVVSVVIGVTAGYLTGAAAESMSALANVVLVIPALPLIIIVTTAIPNGGDTAVALVIGFTSWAWGARLLRAQTLSLRNRDFVVAAKASGESTWRIVGFEILPNLTAIIASSFVGTVLFAVGIEVALAFIGVAGMSQWNWGVILYWAADRAGHAAGRLVVVRPHRPADRAAGHVAVAGRTSASTRSSTPACAPAARPCAPPSAASARRSASRRSSGPRTPRTWRPRSPRPCPTSRQRRSGGEHPEHREPVGHRPGRQHRSPSWRSGTWTSTTATAPAPSAPSATSR